MTREERLREVARAWQDCAGTDGSPAWRERAEAYGLCAAQLSAILDYSEPAPDPVIERFMDGPRPKVIAGWLGDCECTEVVGDDGSMWRQCGSSWERMRGPFDGGTS